MTRIFAFLDLMRQSARLMVGQSSYSAYLDHMTRHHSGAPVMDEKAFFRHRQEVRYGGKSGGRCC